ncbi:MAG: hypothetical protein NC293_12790, partial [Roseburia sp.]|nr:hypothetical protein [Roseburia sp.]
YTQPKNRRFIRPSSENIPVAAQGFTSTQLISVGKRGKCLDERPYLLENKRRIMKRNIFVERGKSIC